MGSNTSRDSVYVLQRCTQVCGGCSRALARCAVLIGGANAGAGGVLKLGLIGAMIFLVVASMSDMEIFRQLRHGSQ
jgi:hypothetical protein